MRYQSLDGTGSYETGLLNPAPQKKEQLLDSSGSYFVRSRPQYENNPSFIIATDHGISNDGTGDQSGAINSLLSDSVGTPVFFPAGIYQVQDTVFVPVGSVIVGEGWSQVLSPNSNELHGFADSFRSWRKGRISRMRATHKS